MLCRPPRPAARAACAGGVLPHLRGRRRHRRPAAELRRPRRRHVPARRRRPRGERRAQHRCACAAATASARLLQPACAAASVRCSQRAVLPARCAASMPVLPACGVLSPLFPARFDALRAPAALAKWPSMAPPRLYCCCLYRRPASCARAAAGGAALVRGQHGAQCARACMHALPPPGAARVLLAHRMMQRLHTACLHCRRMRCWHSSSHATVPPAFMCTALRRWVTEYQVDGFCFVNAENLTQVRHAVCAKRSRSAFSEQACAVSARLAQCVRASAAAAGLTTHRRTYRNGRNALPFDTPLTAGPARRGVRLAAVCGGAGRRPAPRVMQADRVVLERRAAAARRRAGVPSLRRAAGVEQPLRAGHAGTAAGQCR